MVKYVKSFLAAFAVLAVMYCGYGIYIYSIEQQSFEEFNICQDDSLIIKLTEENANPFSKFKFIKKRNEDCKKLLISQKDTALKHQPENYCSYIGSSVNSLTVLINFYVHEMYDRESASEAFHTMTPLLAPYQYCPEYMDNMMDLIKLRKRLGL